MIDTHAHLNFPEFEGAVAAVLDRASRVGVSKIINIGTDLQNSKASIALARKYPEIYATVGLHPHNVKELSIDILDRFFVLVAEDEVVAVGEIGLDFYPLGRTSKYAEYPSKKEQETALIQMLKLALDARLPVILHCREAYPEMLKIFQNEGIKGPGVIHCFSGTKKEAQKFLDLGFHISFTGNITYSEEKNELIKKISLSKILLETDCPYLTPEPHRGKRNEPAYVIEIAKKIAQIKGISLVEVEKATTENAKKLFKLK